MSVYAFGPFCLDAARLLLHRDGEALALGPKVVETLLALVERPGEIVSKRELLDRIWPDGFVEEANLAQNVYVLRKTLRAHWGGETIATVPRRGYRFVPPVALLSEAERRPVAVFAPRRPWRRYAVVAAASIAAAFVVGLGGFAAGKPHDAVLAKALSPQGSRLYTMGRYYWNQRTQKGVERSEQYFAELTKTDPHNALGFAELASAYAVAADYGYGKVPMRVNFARARRYAREALALDARSAQAHAVLGMVEDQEDGQVAKAQAEYRRALALDANYAPVHEWYGVSLLEQGKSRAAYTELQRAEDLDPLSVATTAWLAQAAYFTRNYRQSLAYSRQALELSPDRAMAYATMGSAYEALGAYREAVSAYRTFGVKCGCTAETAALLAHVYAEMHLFKDARAELRVARAGIGSRHVWVDPEDVSVALIAMGRRTEALSLLRLAVHRDHADLALIALDPRLDPVRNDARFRAYTAQNPA